MLQETLRHRGPDDRGIFLSVDQRVALAHTRLAILDLSESGHQPMAWCPQMENGGRSWIVFNGEIYNFRELRAELAAAGEEFSGHSDTEVLLRLLVREGRAALPKLAGMFAFAFWDEAAGRALLARDAMGIKPLYVRREGSELEFASECRALRRESDTPDGAAARDFLLWGSVPEPATLTNEVRQIPAGGWLEWDGGKVSQGLWRRLRFNGSGRPADPAATVRKALEESVARHLVSDVPVGIFLSGGIDSTAVLALARKVLGESADIRTFSIGFDDPAYDESSAARRTADHFGASHTEWRMTAEDGGAEIPAFLAAVDQPGIDGFNTWCVSKLARREGMKVVLSGLGGDELFAGYESFKRVPWFRRVRRMSGPLRWLAVAGLRRAAPGSRWRRLAEFFAGPGGLLAAYHAQRGVFPADDARRLAAHLLGSDPGPPKWELPDAPDDAADAVSWLELTRYMRNQLLRDSDVYSMAHGLELRVPFVDVRLFEAVAAIPAPVRLRPGKKLLLEAVPEIPREIAEAPKRGFRFPFQEWLSTGFGAQFRAATADLPVPTPQWYQQWAVFGLRKKLETLKSSRIAAIPKP